MGGKNLEKTVSKFVRGEVTRQNKNEYQSKIY